ncbi:MAG: hypothetical protein NT062_11225 [Proteobacteria bacterium]|nr:hypothetical protein [Pseudomonadota bacterium]
MPRTSKSVTSNKAARPSKKNPRPGNRVSLWAVKPHRAGKNLAWMPNEVIVDLDGERTGKLLEFIGWTTIAGPSNVRWPSDRIEANRWRIEHSWAEDFGNGWKLEVR